jgi:hypothetical protein
MRVKWVHKERRTWAVQGPWFRKCGENGTSSVYLGYEVLLHCVRMNRLIARAYVEGHKIHGDTRTKGSRERAQVDGGAIKHVEEMERFL